MAIDKSIYVPLYTELSTAVESPFFHIFPGDIALIQAFGFGDYKARSDKTELQVPQVACLEMLLFREGVLPARADVACPLLDMKRYYTHLLAIETMRVNGCAFSLSRQNNTMLLNIPGSYRFVLNDAAALGNARLFLRVFSKEEFPWDSRFFIGAQL